MLHHEKRNVAALPSSYQAHAVSLLGTCLSYAPIIVIVDASDHHRAWCQCASHSHSSILRGVKDSVRLCVAGTVNAPEAAARDSDKQLLMCSECTAQDDEHRSGLCKSDGIHMPPAGQTFQKYLFRALTHRLVTCVF